MDELDSVSLHADQLVATVRDWWDGTRSGGQLREHREAAVAESWHAFRGVLESETQASVWLPLAAPGPSWQVPAPPLPQPEYVRVHVEVTVDDPDRDRIADVLGPGDATRLDFLDEAAALIGEYGWDVASCTDLALRIVSVDAHAWWDGGTDRGEWLVDVEALDLEPGTRIADSDNTIARFAAALEMYVASERLRLMLDGQDGYWEVVVAAQALAEGLAAQIDAIDADAWSRGSASPFRAALHTPRVEDKFDDVDTSDPIAERLHIAADAVFAFANDSIRVPDSSATGRLPKVMEWLRTHAWQPPFGDGLPTHRVTVTIELDSGGGTPIADS